MFSLFNPTNKKKEILLWVSGSNSTQWRRNVKLRRQKKSVLPKRKRRIFWLLSTSKIFCRHSRSVRSRRTVTTAIARSSTARSQTSVSNAERTTMCVASATIKHATDARSKSKAMRRLRVYPKTHFVLARPFQHSQGHPTLHGRAAVVITLLCYKVW